MKTNIILIILLLTAYSSYANRYNNKYNPTDCLEHSSFTYNIPKSIINIEKYIFEDEYYTIVKTNNGYGILIHIPSLCY